MGVRRTGLGFRIWRRGTWGIRCGRVGRSCLVVRNCDWSTLMRGLATIVIWTPCLLLSKNKRCARHSLEEFCCRTEVELRNTLDDAAMRSDSKLVAVEDTNLVLGWDERCVL